MAWPWFAKAQKEAPAGWAGSARTRDWPAAMLVPPPAKLMAGKDWTLRDEPVGQDVMNCEAKVKTARGPRAVSKAFGTGTALLAVRMKV